MSVHRLGPLVREKRGVRGVRETAKDVGVSPATLSRVERGLLPDLETFRRLCDWLKVDPAGLLGLEDAGHERDSRTETGPIRPSVHFRADSAVSEQAARDLAQLILAAQAEVTHRGLR